MQNFKIRILEFRDVLYPGKRGLNVIIPDKDQKRLAYNLRNKFKVHGGGIVTVCPNYNRVKLKAVCIEIKNLDINCLTPANLNSIIDIIKNPF